MALGAGVVVALAIVGIGLLGGRPTTTPEPRPVIALGPESPATDAGVIDPEILVVTSPRGPGVEITTRRLTIEGHLRATTAVVSVSLEARGNRVIDTFVTQPTATFEVGFDLPNPRPNGRMVVSVMVLGPTGGMIDAIRWPVVIGAIAETAPPRPSLGEDGLMGGLVFTGS